VHAATTDACAGGHIYKHARMYKFTCMCASAQVVVGLYSNKYAQAPACMA